MNNYNNYFEIANLSLEDILYIMLSNNSAHIFLVPWKGFLKGFRL